MPRPSGWHAALLWLAVDKSPAQPWQSATWGQNGRSFNRCVFCIALAQIEQFYVLPPSVIPQLMPACNLRVACRYRISAWNGLVYRKGVVVQIVFITDLDGTLLGHEDFSFASIRHEIRQLMARGITIIPNSSKTRVEIEHFCDQLGARLPFVCENGAALVRADLLTTMCGERAVNAKSAALSGNGFTAYGSTGHQRTVLGRTVDQLMSDWVNWIDPALRQQCRFLDSMPEDMQSAILGLSGDGLARALAREYSVLFCFQGGQKDFARLRAEAAAAGLRIHRGGRVCCLSGQHDKASFNGMIRRLCGTVLAPAKLIGFGDSDNDVALLCAADVACVVPRHRMPALSLPNPPPTVITVPRPAPSGWVMAANRALTVLDG